MNPTTKPQQPAIQELYKRIAEAKTREEINAAVDEYVTSPTAQEDLQNSFYTIKHGTWQLQQEVAKLQFIIPGLDVQHLQYLLNNFSRNVLLTVSLAQNALRTPETSDNISASR